MSKSVLSLFLITYHLISRCLFFDSALDWVTENSSRPFVLACRLLITSHCRAIECIRIIDHWWSQLDFEERGRAVGLQVSLLSLEVPTIDLCQTIIGKILVIWVQVATLFRVQKSNNTSSFYELIIVVFIIITINTYLKFGLLTWKIHLA